MNYLFIVIGVSLILLGIFLLLQVKSIRDKANALFLEAEKSIDEEKLLYVSVNLYEYLPTILRVFINEYTFTVILQKIYDNTRKLAKDILNDGKINGK